MGKRSLPQSVESEKKVLAYMTLYQELLIQGMKSLKSHEYFHKPAHGFIWGALDSIYQKDKKPSLVVLEEELKLQKTLEKAGPSNLVELMEVASNKEEFDSVLEIVVDKYHKRNVIKVSRELNTLSYSDSIEGEEFIKQAKDTFASSISNNFGKIQVVSSGDIWETRRQNLIAQAQTEFLDINFKNLDDRITGGWMRKQVSVMAGRPGMGKSALKSSFILGQLIKGRRVVSFAPEQGFNVEQARLEALMTEIPLKEILESYKWRGKDYRIKHIRGANQRIDKEFKYHIIPTRGLSTKDVRPILYEIAQKYGPIDWITVDLFDKFTDVNTTDNTVNAIAVGLQNLATYAEEFNAHVNLLVQISREAEKKGDKRPKISNLKNSGAYEEVARLILLLFREKYYFPDSLNNDVEVNIAKQSNGPTDTVLFEFKEDILGFEEKDEFFSGSI